MRTLVHLSDIHFGRVDYDTVRPLVDAVERIKPSLVVVSGDLTQRARTNEFAEARRFLDALPQPQLVVPGNHDVPLWNVAARFLAPLSGYRRYIGGGFEPYYADDEIVVQGLNTARSWTWKNGRLNAAQVSAACRRFAGAAPGVVKILVTHHPLDLPPRFGDEHLVGRATTAVPQLAACGVDVLLAGHYHLSHSGDTRARYPIDSFAAIVVQAGTTISSRLRDDEPNAFNLLHVAATEIVVDRFTWRPADERFDFLVQERFDRTPQGWSRRASTSTTS